MKKKVYALLLVPVALGLFILVPLSIIIVSDPDFAKSVGAALVLAGFAVMGVANSLWQAKPGTASPEQAIPAGHRACDWCSALVPESDGRWKTVVTAVADGRTGRQFVCSSCRRASWRNVLLLLVLIPVVIAVSYFLTTSTIGR